MSKWTTILILVLLLGASYGIGKNYVVNSEAEAKAKLFEKSVVTKNYCEINSEPYKNATNEYEVDNNPKLVAYTIHYVEDNENKTMPTYTETRSDNESQILKDIETDCENKFAQLQTQLQDNNNTITIQYNNGITGQKYDLNQKKWNK